MKVTAPAWLQFLVCLQLSVSPSVLPPHPLPPGDWQRVVHGLLLGRQGALLPVFNGGFL